MDLIVDARDQIELQESVWQEAVSLMQTLIQCHPIYGSNGQRMAQTHVLSYMKKHNWDLSFQCEYSAQDLKDDPHYVDVTAFGPHYKDYENLPKCNIIGIINGACDGPTVLLNGHVDVDLVTNDSLWSIPDGWKCGEIINDSITGRGATDMISGLVSLLTVASVMHSYKAKWKGRVIVTSVVDEEIGGNGTLYALRWLSNRGYLHNHTECLIAEPSNQKVCTESLGFMHLVLSFKRGPVHMGVAKKVNNAIWDMQRCIENFESIVLNLVPAVDRDRIRLNFGIVKGGVDSAIPIGELDLEATLFYPEEINAKALIKNVQAQMIRMDINVDIQVGDFGFAGARFTQAELFNALCSAPYSSGIFPSPCDARLFKQYGIPTVIFGPGNLEQAHAVNEHIQLQEVKTYICHVLKGLFSYLRSYSG